MRTKRKISVTIDANILERVEQASETYHIAKSHLAQEAFMLWLKQKTEERMAKGYAEMAKEDKKFVELSFESQRDVLS